MGGLAGLMFARAHPARVERLMVVDALPYFPVLLSGAGAELKREQVEPIAKAMRDTVAARYGKPLDAAKIKADVNGLALRPESRAQMAVWAAAADPRVTAQLLYEDMSTDLRPALAGLKIPVTVVVPWTDTSFGKDRTMAFYRRQYAANPAITYADIPDRGHFVMLDQPVLFRGALDTFLGR
jgi:pimeloyl-ACP methyl ester carboxylesterase